MQPGHVVQVSSLPCKDRTSHSDSLGRSIKSHRRRIPRTSIILQPDPDLNRNRSSWFTWWLCPGGSKPLVTCSDSSGSTYNVVGDCEDDCECNDDDYCE